MALYNIPTVCRVLNHYNDIYIIQDEDYQTKQVTERELIQEIKQDNLVIDGLYVEDDKIIKDHISLVEYCFISYSQYEGEDSRGFRYKCIRERYNKPDELLFHGIAYINNMTIEEKERFYNLVFNDAPIVREYDLNEEIINSLFNNSNKWTPDHYYNLNEKSRYSVIKTLFALAEVEYELNMKYNCPKNIEEANKGLKWISEDKDYKFIEKNNENGRIQYVFMEINNNKAYESIKSHNLEKCMLEAEGDYSLIRDWRAYEV